MATNDTGCKGKLDWKRAALRARISCHQNLKQSCQVHLKLSNIKLQDGSWSNSAKRTSWSPPRRPPRDRHHEDHQVHLKHLRRSQKNPKLKTDETCTATVPSAPREDSWSTGSRSTHPMHDWHTVASHPNFGWFHTTQLQFWSLSPVGLQRAATSVTTWNLNVKTWDLNVTKTPSLQITNIFLSGVLLQVSL